MEKFRHSTPADAMALLRRLVEASWTPALAKAKPIVFDFLIERWTFDPARRNVLVAKGDKADAPLRITASARTVIRLLTQRGFVPDEYELYAAGDGDALAPVIDALK